MRTIHTTLMTALLLSSACVTQKRFNELQTRYEELEGRYSALQTSADGQKVELTELEQHVETLRASNEYLGSFYSELLGEFRAQLDDGTMEVVVYPDRMSLALAQDVTFRSGSSSLTKAGGDTLDALADLLERHPNRRFHVEGHTDSVPIATGRYRNNWELGAARAVAVIDALIDQGVPAHRLAATTYGDTAPLAPNEDAEGRRTNRRVEIAFQPTLEELPGHLALVEAAAENVRYAEGADATAIPEKVRDQPLTSAPTPHARSLALAGR